MNFNLNFSTHGREGRLSNKDFLIYQESTLLTVSESGLAASRLPSWGICCGSYSVHLQNLIKQSVIVLNAGKRNAGMATNKGVPRFPTHIGRSIDLTFIDVVGQRLTLIPKMADML